MTIVMCMRVFFANELRNHGPIFMYFSSLISAWTAMRSSPVVSTGTEINKGFVNYVIP